MNSTSSSSSNRYMRYISRLLIRFKKTLYWVLGFVLIASLFSLPLRANLVRDVWTTFESSASEPPSNPWIYSICGTLEFLHLIVLTFAVFAVYDQSVPRCYIFAFICITFSLLLVISLIWFCCHLIIVATIIVESAVGSMFIIFARFLSNEVYGPGGLSSSPLVSSYSGSPTPSGKSTPIFI